MKKMNNKGVTLVELIVSFAIVGVAVVYFYQTVNTVSKLYKTSKDDTNDYANATYVLRLVDAKLDDLKKTYKSSSGKNINLTSDAKNNLSDFCTKIGASCSVSGPSTDVSDPKYHKYVITVTPNGGKSYKLYRRGSVKIKKGTKTITTYSDNRTSITEFSGDANCSLGDCEIVQTGISTSTFYENYRSSNQKSDTATFSRKDGCIGIWRTFNVCNKLDITNELTYSALNCSLVEVPDLPKYIGYYVIPFSSSEFKNDYFKCSGIFHNKYDPVCIRTWGASGYPTSGSVSYKIDSVTKKGTNVCPNYDVKWTGLKPTRDTITATITTYDVYKYQD